MKLTPLAKTLITIVVVAAVGLVVYTQRNKLFPGKKPTDSTVPVVPTISDGSGGSNGATKAKPPIALDTKPGCPDKPEVRIYNWAWNSQMGMMYAVGGKQATADSLMCKHGVNAKLIREDDTNNMQSQLAAFAEQLKSGAQNPDKGAHFIIIMGDGGAQFFKAMNDRLDKLGKDYEVEVVGSTGYSRGEDKLMGPQQWKDNPQSARGGLVAGVLRDGDWNIAMKWLGDNGIPNNPDETAYDPDAMNWVNANDYIEAATKYITGFCVDMKNKKTGSKDKHCVQGIVTWTPGDVNEAEQKGGIVSIVSTEEYRSQMPSIIIGNKKWINANHDLVKNMLAAIFEGGDAVKTNPDALRQAAAVSAVVYNEKDGDYWQKYFTPQVVTDKSGIQVRLGGSAVSNLADNIHLFGLDQGAVNLFAATYTTFGNVVKQQYPDLVPNFPPVSDILDMSFVKELNASTSAAQKGTADVAKFDPTQVKQQAQVVVSRKNWNIQFDTGKATFSGGAEDQLKKLLNDLVIASGTTVEIHGHTDNQGAADANMQLSEDRAFAVKKWLEAAAPANFPDGRIKVFAHGQTNPLVSNATSDGKAKNRRVEIVLGATQPTT